MVSILAHASSSKTRRKTSAPTWLLNLWSVALSLLVCRAPQPTHLSRTCPGRPHRFDGWPAHHLQLSHTTRRELGRDKATDSEGNRGVACVAGREHYIRHRCERPENGPPQPIGERVVVG